MQNKSDSRRAETALIAELKSAGYELGNVEVGGDGSHVLFGGSTAAQNKTRKIITNDKKKRLS
jgi:hypothetical protein